MVTNRRLRWVPHVTLEFEAALLFDDVTAFSERSLKHRYAIELEHGPITRTHTVPAHRFLRFEWGDDVVTDSVSRTGLAFSRRDTEAAQALRQQVSDRLDL
jgi:hypothetical protein